MAHGVAPIIWISTTIENFIKRSTENRCIKYCESIDCRSVERIEVHTRDMLLITKMTADEVKDYLSQLDTIKKRWIRCTHRYETNETINFLCTA